MQFETFRNFILTQSHYDYFPSNVENRMGMGVDNFNHFDFFTEGVGDVVTDPLHIDQDDINFMYQFDPKFWAQAFAQRYELLFDVLEDHHKFLQEKAGYNFLIKKVRNSFDTRNWNWIHQNPQLESFFKDKISDFQDSDIWEHYDKDEEAEIIASQFFEEIEPIKMPDPNQYKTFNLKEVGGKEGKTIQIKAQPMLKSLYDKLIAKGFDLTNPQRANCTASKCVREVHVTAGFKFPSRKKIEQKIIEYKRLVANGYFGKIPSKIGEQDVNWIRASKGEDKIIIDELKDKLIRMYFSEIRKYVKNGIYSGDDQKIKDASANIMITDAGDIKRIATILANDEIMRRAKKGELVSTSVPGKPMQITMGVSTKVLSALTDKLLQIAQRKIQNANLEIKPEIIEILKEYFSKNGDKESAIKKRAEDKFVQLFPSGIRDEDLIFIDEKGKRIPKKQRGHVEKLAKRILSDQEVENYAADELKKPRLHLPTIKRKITYIEDGKEVEKEIDMPVLLQSHAFRDLTDKELQALIDPETGEFNPNLVDTETNTIKTSGLKVLSRGGLSAIQVRDNKEELRNPKVKLKASFEPNFDSQERRHLSILNPKHRERYKKMLAELSERMVFTPSAEEVFPGPNDPKIGAKTLVSNSLLPEGSKKGFYADIILGILNCMKYRCGEASEQVKKLAYEHVNELHDLILKVLLQNLATDYYVSDDDDAIKKENARKNRIQKAFSFTSMFVQRNFIDSEIETGSRKKRKLSIRTAGSLEGSSDDKRFDRQEIDTEQVKGDDDKSAVAKSFRSLATEIQKLTATDIRQLRKVFTQLEKTVKDAGESEEKGVAGNIIALAASMQSDKAFEDLYSKMLQTQEQKDQATADALAKQKIQAIKTEVERTVGKKDMKKYLDKMLNVFSQDDDVRRLQQKEVGEEFALRINCPKKVNPNTCKKLEAYINALIAEATKTNEWVQFDLRIKNKSAHKMLIRQSYLRNQELEKYVGNIVPGVPTTYADKEYSRLVDMTDSSEEDKEAMQKQIEKFMANLYEKKSSLVTDTDADDDSSLNLELLTADNFYQTATPEQIAQQLTLHRQELIRRRIEERVQLAFKKLKDYLLNLDVRKLAELTNKYQVHPEYAQLLLITSEFAEQKIELLSYFRTKGSTVYPSEELNIYIPELSKAILKESNIAAIWAGFMKKLAILLEYAYKIDDSWIKTQFKDQGVPPEEIKEHLMSVRSKIERFYKGGYDSKLKIQALSKLSTLINTIGTNV